LEGTPPFWKCLVRNDWLNFSSDTRVESSCCGWSWIRAYYRLTVCHLLVNSFEDLFGFVKSKFFTFIIYGFGFRNATSFLVWGNFWEEWGWCWDWREAPSMSFLTWAVLAPTAFLAVFHYFRNSFLGGPKYRFL
jgi:hypothetical protein